MDLFSSRSRTIRMHIIFYFAYKLIRHLGETLTFSTCDMVLDEMAIMRTGHMCALLVAGNLRAYGSCISLIMWADFRL